MNINAIDLRLLRGLLTIARSGTFGSAAQQLHITQSALSQQMKELSERLELSLFQRQGRQATLNHAGRELVDRIAPLLDQLSAALEQSTVQTQRVAGSLRVGATQTYFRALALPAALDLIDSHAELRLDMRQLPAQRLLADLLDGELDVAVLPELPAQRNLSLMRLMTERLAVIGRPDVLASLDRSPSLRSLAGRPLALLNQNFLMRQQIDRQARQDKVALDVRLEVSGMDDLAAVARSSSLLVIGSHLACAEDAALAFKPLAGKFLSRGAALYWPKGRFQAGSLQAFQNSVHKISAQFASIESGAARPPGRS